MGINMYKLNGLIALSMMSLVGCGGGSSSGGGGGPIITNGVFKDSNVSGLSYESGNQKDVTDKNGGFRFEEGADVSFNVGGVSLGTGKGKSVMTPLDLVDDGKLTTPEVINRVRFLMMLDDDQDPKTGIGISKKIQDLSKDWEDVDFTSATFPNEALFNMSNAASAADGVARTFPSVEDATAHLRSTLLCANAGAFKGAYTGASDGNIVLIVNPVTGAVSGASYNAGDETTVEVKSVEIIDYDNGLDFISKEDSSKQFTGKLTSTDEMDGSWSDSTETGVFDATRFGSNDSSKYRYVATFSGQDKGVFTFNVDESSKVTGSVYSVRTGEESKIKGSINSSFKLEAESDAGDEITGFIDSSTLAFTSGVWLNGQTQTSGGFTGGGCILN